MFKNKGIEMALFLTSKNFEEEVSKSELPVVIDAFAEWCGPCKMIAPIFEELSKELSDKYKLVKLNVDEERDLAIQHNVSSIPTFIFIKEGKVIGRETGFMNKDALKEKIEDILG